MLVPTMNSAFVNFVRTCEMGGVRWLFCAILLIGFCKGQFLTFRSSYGTTPSPLPFPTCRADDVDCLRRGIRTFFFLMDSRHFGMTPVDPSFLNSVAVNLPEDEMSFLMRKVNVTGVRWSKLLNRELNGQNGRSSVKFISDLHVTAEMRLTIPTRVQPYVGFITLDLQNVETNITYILHGLHGRNNEDYILIGPERIVVRNMRTPSFFIQPNTVDSIVMEQALNFKPSVLEHLTNEITTALMHSVVDNLRLFASKVPVKHYYTYF